MTAEDAPQRFCEITVTVLVGDVDKPYGWPEGGEFDRFADALHAVAGLLSPDADISGRFYVLDANGTEVSSTPQPITQEEED